MDKMLRIHQKRATKKPKSTKKKPVKVVYISNPMKVKTSASQFRALVQQLTGQDADFPDPTKFSDMESVGGGGGQEMMKAMEEEDEVNTRAGAEVENPTSSSHEMGTRSHESVFSLETFEDGVVFMPHDYDQQMLESFTSGLVSSNYLSSPSSWNGSAVHIADQELKSLDAL